jgi:hypothetical protein
MIDNDSVKWLSTVITTAFFSKLVLVKESKSSGKVRLMKTARKVKGLVPKQWQG